MRVPVCTSSPSRETMPATAPHPQGWSYLLRDSHIANNPRGMALDGRITSAHEFHMPGLFLFIVYHIIIYFVECL